MSDSADKDQDQLPEREAEKRRDEALKRALGMSHVPHGTGEASGPLGLGDYFIVVGGKLRIAREVERHDDGSVTAEVYRNLEDYRRGAPMGTPITFGL